MTRNSRTDFSIELPFCLKGVGVSEISLTPCSNKIIDNYYHVVSTQFRKIDELHYEMTCTFENFNADLLKSQNSISYKYVVHSAKIIERDDCFEYLHAHQRHGDVDRCLLIPPETLLRLYNGGNFMSIGFVKVTY